MSSVNRLASISANFLTWLNKISGISHARLIDTRVSFIYIRGTDIFVGETIESSFKLFFFFEELFAAVNFSSNSDSIIFGVTRNLFICTIKSRENHLRL